MRIVPMQKAISKMFDNGIPHILASSLSGKPLKKGLISRQDTFDKRSGLRKGTATFSSCNHTLATKPKSVTTTNVT